MDHVGLFYGAPAAYKMFTEQTHPVPTLAIHLRSEKPRRTSTSTSTQMVTLWQEEVGIINRAENFILYFRDKKIFF